MMKNTALNLSAVLANMGLKHAAAARAAGVPTGSWSKLCAGTWQPAAAHKYATIVQRTQAWLRTQGASDIEIAAAFLPQANLAIKSKPTTEEVSMLLRKQTLGAQTLKHFGLMRDPFNQDINVIDDVFMSVDARYVRQFMQATVDNGGMLAVVGESGAGKSTLRLELIERMRDKKGVIIIEPYVLAMEENDLLGKTLKSAAIAESILRCINPLSKPKRSPDARFAQVHDELRRSGQNGNKHVLIIEEAHALPTATLKHLKRFVELADGMKRLLSIILIGQPELAQKLSEKNNEVREVVQRCQVISLPSLGNDLEAYLAHKLSRPAVGGALSKVINKSGLDAMRTRLTAGSGAKAVSVAYPLMAANLLSAAMNIAAELGAAIVDEHIVTQVGV